MQASDVDEYVSFYGPRSGECQEGDIAINEGSSAGSLTLNRVIREFAVAKLGHSNSVGFRTLIRLVEVGKDKDVFNKVVPCLISNRNILPSIYVKYESESVSSILICSASTNSQRR